MLTDTLTALLLTLGALLASFGAAGFAGNWHSHPDHDSLRYLRALALTGQALTATGTALHLAAHALPAMPPALTAVALLIAATGHLTRTSNHIIPTGATP